jgi:hypothetical protein
MLALYDTMAKYALIQHKYCLKGGGRYPVLGC